MVFLVFSKYGKRRNDAVRGHVRGAWLGAEAPDSAAAAVGASRRDDCQRHSDRARNTKLDAFTSSRKAQNGGPGHRSQRQTVAVVFGKREGSPGLAGVPLRGMLHAKQRGGTCEDHFREAAAIDFEIGEEPA